MWVTTIGHIPFSPTLYMDAVYSYIIYDFFFFFFKYPFVPDNLTALRKNIII